MPTKQQLQTELKVLKEDRANLEREIREAWACARKFEDAYRKAIESPSAPSELRGPAAQGPTLDAKWLMHTANYWRARGNQEGAAKWREGLEMIHARAVGVLFHQPAVKAMEARSAPERSEGPQSPCPGIVSKDCANWTCTYGPDGICRTCNQPRPVEGGKGPGGAG